MSLRDALFEFAGRRVFYGWVILAVSCLGIFASGPGQSHTFSVFVGPLQEDLGISASGIASAYGLATLAAALCLPFVGRLVDRLGARKVSLGVVVLLGLACLAFGAVTNMFALALGFAGLRFLGQGSMMLTNSNLVSQWFDKRRGFALSLMAAGFALSMAIHPPLGQFLIEQVGWRQAWVVLGILTWALMLPPVIWLVRDKPEEVGLRPDGRTPPAGTPNAGARTDGDLVGLTLSQALRTSTFYIVAVGMGGVSMLVTGLHFYQVSIFETQGLSVGLASQIFTLSAVVMVVSMPLIGSLLDRLRTEVMFAMNLTVMAAALLAASVVRDTTTAVLYGVIFGISNAANMTMFAYLWPRYFGRRYLGSIQGVGQTIGVVGASLGPLPLGIAVDLTGSYAGTLQVRFLPPLAWALLALFFLRTPAALAAE
jgi:MFS family permease